MRYVSTRGRAAEAGFSDVLLTGLAPDGGLYVPVSWPSITPQRIAAFSSTPYADVATEIAAPFCEGEIEPETLRLICSEAYAGFRHPAVTPLVQLGTNRWLLELFHGPTYAFKDLAMQLLSRLMDHVLAERDERATIVVATSGDTGGSAVEAFRGADRIDLFVLFPNGRISEVQRRQMTTAGDANVHTLAVDGSFDDCQALVKALFAKPALRDEVSLAAVNSINWARIVAQVTYYFVAAAALGAPARATAFCVPTGNFGDIYAGHVASRMGLPLEQLAIATNSNDILARTLESGRYEVRDVVPTTSPSMDIQISSNFERLLWEASKGDGEAVSTAMERLKQSGAFDIDGPALAAIKQDFTAGSADEAAMAEALSRTLDDAGYLADPHTAVALSVAGRMRSEAPLVTLATAHPAKFPDAVESVVGYPPERPAALAALFDREELFTEIAADVGAVERHIMDHARAARMEA